MSDYLLRPANDEERTRVLCELANGKPAEYITNGEVYRLVTRKPKSTPAGPTPEELVEISNKHIIEIVGVWLVMSQQSRRAWMYKRGWKRRSIDAERWDHDELGGWRTEDEVFKLELSRALFNARSLA